MEKETMEKLNKLFSRFAQETQASSFAVENLLNKVTRIIQEDKNKNN